MKLIKNTKSIIRVSILVMLLFFVSNVFANVKLPAIFSDGMVLQQQSKVAVWGWADPGEQITITGSWSVKSVSIATNESGNWKGMLQTPKAGGPYTVKIKGNNSIELADVLIGEVWVCSGQSNMVFALKGSEGAKEEIPLADFPSIRYFNVKRQYGPKAFEDAPGSVWQKTTPQTAPNFSAVAYYFAKKIHKDLKVPVGIVYAAWGGTPAEAWTPEEILRSDDSLSVYIDRWKKIQENVGKDSTVWHVELDKWKKDSIASKRPAEPQTLYYYKRPWREPGVLFNGMINPVIPYAVKGVLWYQGESNVAYADEYSHLFSSMIKSWRTRWNTDLPFYFVQLPPFGYSDLDAAARLRKAQQEVADKILQTGMIATIDLGNMKDIHPTRKKEVGDRLAILALNKTYRFKDLVFLGPSFKKAVIKKGEVHLNFDQKLFTTNHQETRGFEIGYKQSGSDSLVFVKAESRLEGNEVIVWNKAIKIPLIIRYAWINIGEANLVNDAGLPALPFSEKIK
ncbi:MAG: sialate O-acetylesterase [Bacteroidota bacterium]|nr:sialate O-acetylesterase [Bacteroidota bacterium]